MALALLGPTKAIKARARAKDLDLVFLDAINAEAPIILLLIVLGPAKVAARAMKAERVSDSGKAEKARVKASTRAKVKVTTLCLAFRMPTMMVMMRQVKM